ncbi:hypothetical protein CsSME_00042763 [Camellia sinensis var. sinensis]
MGQDQGQSSLIEGIICISFSNNPNMFLLFLSWFLFPGFTAGGFVYIAVAKVLAEMNNGSSLAIKSTVLQLTSLISGMTITLCMSLVE